MVRKPKSAKARYGVPAEEKEKCGWLHYALVAAAAVIPYFNAMWCQTCFDDKMAVKDNLDTRGVTSIGELFRNDFWGTPMHKEQSHKSYRPLTVLSYRLTWAICKGLNTKVFHLENVFYHLLVCLMFFKFSQRFLNVKPALLSAVLFAIHPVHTESVTALVGRADVLSALLSLFVLEIYFSLDYRRHSIAEEVTRLIWVVPIAAGAMLFKEIGITVVGVCGIYELWRERRYWDRLEWRRVLNARNIKELDGFKRSFTRLVILGGTGCFLLVIRLLVQGGTLPQFTDYDNPALHQPFPSRQLTYSYLIAVNVKLVLFPFVLLCDWSMGTIPVVKSVLDLRNLETLVVFVVPTLALYLAWKLSNRRKRGIILISVLLIIIPFLPATNLFFPVGFVIAERILYVPTLGWCMLFGIGASRVIRKNKKWIGFIFAYFLILSTRVYLRNVDWQSEHNLFASSLRATWLNSKHWNNVGHTLEDKDWPLALKYFKLGFRMTPDDVGSMKNVAKAYGKLGMNRKSEMMLRHAIAHFPDTKGKMTVRISPRDLDVHLMLGRLIAKDPARAAEAESMLKQVMKWRKDYIDAYNYLGELYVDTGRLKEAVELFEQALLIDSRRVEVLHNMGVAYLKTQDKRGAVEMFKRCLEIDNQHAECHGNLGLVKIGSEFSESERLDGCHELELAFNIRPDSRYAQNIGVTLFELNKHREGEKWMKKSLKLDPKYVFAMYNLANHYKKVGKTIQCYNQLLDLLKVDSSHINAWLLRADIEANFFKNNTAVRESYRAIQLVRPESLEAKHNLCVLDFKEKKYQAADRCFADILYKLPKEGYDDYRKQVEGIVKDMFDQMRNEGYVFE